MPLKSFSLIETAPGSGRYHLSDAYDMLPVNRILQTDKDQMALTLNGKNRNLRRSDYLTFADTCGLERNVATKLLQLVIDRRETYLEMCAAFPHLPKERKDALCELLSARTDTLSNQP